MKITTHNIAGIALCITLLICLTACDKPSVSREQNLQEEYNVSTPKIDNLSTYLAKEPTNAIALSARGFAFAMLGESRAAIADFEKSLELAPENTSITWSYGWALFNLGMHERALEQWQKSINMRDERPWWASHTLALGFWTTGQKTEALKQYDSATKEHPEKFADWNALQTYTSFWTWEEKQQIYQIFDAWHRAY